VRRRATLTKGEDSAPIHDQSRQVVLRQAGGTPRKLARALQHANEGRSLAELPGRREVLFVHAVSPAAKAVRVFAIGKGGRLRRRPGDDGQPFVDRFLSKLPWAMKRLAKCPNLPD
jgi:hypothetical protein